MPYVVMLSGAAKGKAIKLEGEVTLGRHRSCDLVIRLAQISRRHAKISPKGPGWEIADLGTQNGTQVNGEKVVVQLLKDGDEIQISSVKMRFRDEAAAPAPAAAAPAAAPAAAAAAPAAPAAAPNLDGTARNDADGTARNVVGDTGDQPAVAANVPTGGGIRFGLGGLASGAAASEAEDPAEGTAFMDMSAILDHDKEATEFIDMNELMLGDDSGPTLPKGPVAILGLLIVGLVGVLIFLQTRPPDKIPPRPLPALVLQRGSKLIYTLPKYDRYELSNPYVVTVVEKGAGLVEMIGMKRGEVTMTLYATEGEKKITYAGSIEVKVPIDQLICNAVRTEHKGKPASAIKRLAQKWMREAKSLHHTRNQHLSNLYKAYLKAQRANCLMEQQGRSDAVFYESKDLVGKANAELEERFAASTRKIKQFISLREWRGLKKELNKILELLPDKRDWRNQRARRLKDFYNDKLPRD